MNPLLGEADWTEDANSDPFDEKRPALHKGARKNGNQTELLALRTCLQSNPSITAGKPAGQTDV